MKPTTKAALALLACAASFGLLTNVLHGSPAQMAAGVPVTTKLLRVPVWPADGNIPDSLQKQYVFYEPSTNSYVISYPEKLADPDGLDQRTAPARIPLQDGVQPVVSVQIGKTDGVYQYVYQVYNGPSARTAINYISFIVNPDSKTDLLGLPSWTGTKASGAHGKQVALSDTPAGAYMSLFPLPGSDIAPGATVAGFRIASDFKPGFTTAYFQGGPAPQSDTELPTEVVNQLAPLLDRQWNSRQFLTFGPLFAPDASKTVIASNFYQGITRLTGYANSVRVREGSGLPDWSEIKSKIVYDRPMLNDESPFVKEALAKLYEYMTAEGETKPAWTDVRARPASQLEIEVAAALSLAMKN